MELLQSEELPKEYFLVEFCMHNVVVISGGKSCLHLGSSCLYFWFVFALVLIDFVFHLD